MSPNSTSPSSSRSPLLLAVGVVIVVAGIWAITEGFGSDKGGSGVQEQGEQTGRLPNDGVAGKVAEPSKSDEIRPEGGAMVVDSGNSEQAPKPTPGDLALAAKEKGFADIIHEPNSTPKQVVASVRGLLSDRRLEHAGVAEMLNLLPHAAKRKELALGLLDVATNHPNEPFGSGLIDVFDNSSDTDVKLAALRAIQKHRQFGFSDAELKRMRRTSNDSMVTDEIDRMLDKRKN